MVQGTQKLFLGFHSDETTSLDCKESILMTRWATEIEIYSVVNSTEFQKAEPCSTGARSCIAILEQEARHHRQPLQTPVEREGYLLQSESRREKSELVDLPNVKLRQNAHN